MFTLISLAYKGQENGYITYNLRNGECVYFLKIKSDIALQKNDPTLSIGLLSAKSFLEIKILPH